MKFEDLQFKPHPMPTVFSTQATHTFPNGWGVSVITGYGAYGGLELAVLRDGDLHYDNPVALGDVRGYLTEDAVEALMAEIESWPDDVAAVEAMPRENN